MDDSDSRGRFGTSMSIIKRPGESTQRYRTQSPQRYRLIFSPVRTLFDPVSRNSRKISRKATVVWRRFGT